MTTPPAPTPPAAAPAPAPVAPPRPARQVTGLVPREPARASAYVCEAVSCLSTGSQGVLEALVEQVTGEGLADVAVKRVGCLGLCASGPLVQVPETGDVFSHVTPEPSSRSWRRCGRTRPGDERHEAAPFFARQVRIVTERSGLVDPESLDDAVAHGGYEALRQVLTTRTPAEVRDEITASGLRGRGGAGYPTGLKWNTVAKAPGSSKVVICNADEGDPGAFMDRSVLESDPHRVLEGMAIAAYAVGASTGYVYCRAEYPLAVARLRKAIREAAKHGYLGPSVLDTQFSFEVDVRLGAGAFVCGEETALIASIEGGRGTPRPRPPYPAVSGLRGLPDADQQRRDVREHRADRPQRRGVVRRHRDGQEQGDEGVRARRARRQHRPGRGPDGHVAPRHRVRHRRRASSTDGRSRRSRPADRPAAASPPSSWTCRSTTSRSPPWARSWARAG